MKGLSSSGQYRAHQQVINKRCPFCPALFKVRSALESHLATKHVAQYSKGEINIDNIPDAATDEGQTMMGARSTLFPSSPPPAMPPLLEKTNNCGAEKSNNFEESMRKYYEDTMKQFISDVNKVRDTEPETESGHKTSEALDLSSPPLKHNIANNNQRESGEVDTSHSQETDNTHNTQIYEFEDEQGSLEMEMDSYESPVSPSDPKKRCRTQMTPVQVIFKVAVFF